MMSPLNRGPLLGPRIPPAGIRPPPPPRFGGRLPPPGLPPRMPPLPPMNPAFGPMRQRLPRPGGINRIPSGPMPLFARVRGMAPMVPPMGVRGAGPRGPLMRPWHRRVLPPPILSHMRTQVSMSNGNIKGKALNNAKKVSKLEELELKKPWMTDEIRSEIQKKNKLYAKAKKNKDAKEWEEFKDLRNKVTRMIRDAKNDYLAKHPEQGGQKTDKNAIESEGVQKTENATEQSEQSEQMEQKKEMQPSSEQAHLYPIDEEPYDQRDESYISNSEEDEFFYCEICDKNFKSEDAFSEHKKEHKICGIDGCAFSAHPLLVEKHISMQHSSGLYHRIKNVSTPEDIQKWLLERKKKYPTKANIELKKAEELEKTQRGEIIKQKQDVNNRKRKKLVRSNNQKKVIYKERVTMSSNIVKSREMYRGLYEFSGTLSLRKERLPEENQFVTEIENDYEKDVNHISDEEETLVPLSKFSITTCNIPNLVANYGSASEDSDTPEEVPIKKTKFSSDITIAESKAEVEIIDKIEDANKTHLNEEADRFSNQQSSQEANRVCKISTRNEQNITLNRNRNGKEQNRDRNKKQPYTSQLLQRLLSQSIQHERNLICQCIKYIVDNNFFD